MKIALGAFPFSGKSFGLRPASPCFALLRRPSHKTRQTVVFCEPQTFSALQKRIKKNRQVAALFNGVP